MYVSGRLAYHTVKNLQIASIFSLSVLSCSGLVEIARNGYHYHIFALHKLALQAERPHNWTSSSLGALEENSMASLERLPELRQIRRKIHMFKAASFVVWLSIHCTTWFYNGIGWRQASKSPYFESLWCLSHEENEPRSLMKHVIGLGCMLWSCDIIDKLVQQLYCSSLGAFDAFSIRNISLHHVISGKWNCNKSSVLYVVAIYSTSLHYNWTSCIHYRYWAFSSLGVLALLLSSLRYHFLAVIHNCVHNIPWLSCAVFWMRTTWHSDLSLIEHCEAQRGTAWYDLTMHADIGHWYHSQTTILDQPGVTFWHGNPLNTHCSSVRACRLVISYWENHFRMWHKMMRPLKELIATKSEDLSCLHCGDAVYVTSRWQNDRNDFLQAKLMGQLICWRGSMRIFAAILLGATFAQAELSSLSEGSETEDVHAALGTLVFFIMMLVIGLTVATLTKFIGIPYTAILIVSSSRNFLFYFIALSACLPSNMNLGQC